MDIIQRNNKFYLLLANGELELSEQQVKKRIERGDKFQQYLDQLEKEEPNPGLEDTPKNAAGFITSGKYFDNLISEFEDIYKLSEDRADTSEKLIRFCKNAINKLHHDRKNPKTDHVVIDYYILSWSRVISFLQSLAHQQPEQAPVPEDQPAPQHTGATPSSPETLIRPTLILQLMQADGLFPISNALQGITQEDILLLIGQIVGADRETIQEAIQYASSILLKRGITPENKQERILILEDMERLFEALPYSNIISRVKLLLKIYRETA